MTTGNKSGLPPKTFTHRGFGVYLNDMPTDYGDTVSVSESSCATDYRAWLRVRGVAHLTGNPEAHAGISHGIATGSIAAHLTVEQARSIRDALTTWLEDVEAGHVQEKPDPWRILLDVREYDLGDRSRYKSVDDVNDAIDAALVWRKDHPDD